MQRATTQIRHLEFYVQIFKTFHIVAERTAKSTTKKRNKEIARELEKMSLEKASKKKIGEFIKKLKQE